MANRLRKLGGPNDFTADPGSPLRGRQYRLQRRLRDSGLVERARKRGMKLYLGVKLSNYNNTATPLRDWFDDRGWSEAVLPGIEDLAGAAEQLGFAGLAFDQELYPQRGGRETASWAWDYPGNDRSEREVRAKAKQRGAQIMRAILKGFPGVELVAYYTQLPAGWETVVQKQVNDLEDVYTDNLQLDFWDGLSSVRGYHAIRWLDAIFYKAPQIGSTTWDEALRYNAASIYSLLSREFSGWAYASSRLYLSPFSWIEPGPEPGQYDDARSASHVAEQLRAFRKWGMGGEFANFASRGLRGFDYEPYTEALRAASQPGTVDSEPPDLTVDGGDPAKAKGETIALSGSASDNSAIRAVYWRDDGGREGVATLTLPGGADEGSLSSVSWSVRKLPVARGTTRIWLRAVDIKGLGTVRGVRVTR